jgi:hypothetical protein
MRPRPTITKMAPLPDYRVPSEEGTRPLLCKNFTLDAAGPWKTVQGKFKTQTKRWFLIFRCPLYGLVHIEMLYHMDSASFLASFNRFCSDHRVPSRVKCDNGSNFVCGKKDLHDMWSFVSQSYMEKHKPMVTWDFSPPYAPHQNGLVERMVGAAKSALRTVLEVDNDKVSDEMLHTCFKLVQGLLNNRPIAYESKDPDDYEVITPNHFLLFGGAGADLAPILDFERRGLQNSYQIVLSIVDSFWTQFAREMRPQLHQYHKWINQRPQLNVGDIVVILDQRDTKVGPASRYQLGRVIQTIAGKDGLIRRVELGKYPPEPGGGLTTRGINSVYVILSADNTSIPVNDHEVLRHEVTDHEVSRHEEKECQDNLEVQLSNPEGPEGLVPNVSEVKKLKYSSQVRPQQDLAPTYERIMTRSRVKNNTSVMFCQNRNKTAHSDPAQLMAPPQYKRWTNVAASFVPTVVPLECARVRYLGGTTTQVSRAHLSCG